MEHFTQFKDKATYADKFYLVHFSTTSKINVMLGVLKMPATIKPHLYIERRLTGRAL
jgi:hypothetical protein